MIAPTSSCLKQLLVILYFTTLLILSFFDFFPKRTRNKVKDKWENQPWSLGPYDDGVI